MTSPSTELVESLIRLIRGQRVILDADLAQVYGVPTKRFRPMPNPLRGSWDSI